VQTTLCLPSAAVINWSVSGAYRPQCQLLFSTDTQTWSLLCEYALSLLLSVKLPHVDPKAVNLFLAGYCTGQRYLYLLFCIHYWFICGSQWSCRKPMIVRLWELLDHVCYCLDIRSCHCIVTDIDKKVFDSTDFLYDGAQWMFDWCFLQSTYSHPMLLDVN